MNMLKAFIILLFSAFLLSACSSDSSEEVSKNSNEEIIEKIAQYKIVENKKFKNTEQRQVRVTTEATKEDEFDAITKEIMDEYEGKGLDSMHLYIHAPDGDSFGALKAHSFIAYTQKGAAQTGIEKADSYKIELEEVKNEATKKDSNEPTEEEWQASFQQIALSEAKRYIELTEENGNLPSDRLEEHSGVVQQQADKLTDAAIKERFIKLANLIKENKLEEVKTMVSEQQ
ncbi:hypothetical protein [Cytobacillus firmus]|uniref:hypothetical protein n=1 Tax=Cytobacillus firmus TaxID=1399 RepID=UPI003001C7A3